jgi:hypothetical protein
MQHLFFSPMADRARGHGSHAGTSTALDVGTSMDSFQRFPHLCNWSFDLGNGIITDL